MLAYEPLDPIGLHDPQEASSFADDRQAIDLRENIVRTLVSFLSLLVVSGACARCPPPGQTLDSLIALKASNFAVSSSAARDALAFSLLDCLADPDPILRDGVAYEALAKWMRAGQLDAPMLRRLRSRLYAQLRAGDAAGLQRPFAALVLAEVARTDRVRPWMTPAELADMVDQAAAYEKSIDDYRGFDDKQGWRHAVAHGADWLMQLSLNLRLDRGQTDEILSAVASQIVPNSAHAYVFGEGERLARPVVFIAKRGSYTDAQWRRWFAALPARIGTPELAYADSRWLARRHDLTSFLYAIYFEADQSKDSRIHRLKPAISAALAAIP